MIQGGSPLFKVNGNTSPISGGGLEFDGMTAWLGAHLPSTDCLLDPEHCQGLSLAIKLMLDKESIGYSIARYILDTGAMSTSTMGISLFVVSGKVSCILSTRSKNYQVGSRVTCQVTCLVKCLSRVRCSVYQTM